MGRIALRCSLHQLFVDLLGALQLSGGRERITQMDESIRQTERVAGTAIRVGQPLQRLQPTWKPRRQFGQQVTHSFVLARIDHRDANAREQRHGALALAFLEQRLGDFLRGAEILFIRREDTQGKRGGLVPLAVLQIQVQQKLGRLATFFEVRHAFQDLRGLGEIADGRERSRLNDEGVEILGVDVQRLVGQLLAFGLVAASQCSLRRAHVAFQRFAGLPHGGIKIRQANLDAQVVWFRE